MAVTPSQESLIEVFGTPRPAQQTIARWKLSWRDSNAKVQIPSYAAALKLLRAQEVDPLFYQFVTESTDTFHGASGQFYIIFFKEEDEVYFKLHI